MYIRIEIYEYVYIYAIFTCVNVYVQMYTCICVCASMYDILPCVYMCTCIHVYVYIYICIHMCVRVYIYVYICTLCQSLGALDLAAVEGRNCRKRACPSTGRAAGVGAVLVAPNPEALKPNTNAQTSTSI